MTRVSENSTSHSISYALKQAKRKMEDLQLKGSTLRSINRPSQNPIGNVEAMTLKSRIKNNDQYNRNSDYAELYLTSTEKSLEQVVDILNQAKDIAITQSSDFYDAKIRKNISNEIKQLYNQALAIGNKRVGSRYIFGGYKTLSKPFNAEGEYQGDKGKITVEVSKDFFIPINLNGHEVFYSDDNIDDSQPNPFDKVGPKDGIPEDIQKQLDENNPSNEKINRDLASSEEVQPENKFDYKKKENVFSLLKSMVASLENNDPNSTQNLLEKFDEAINRVITMRTKIGSLMNSVAQSKVANEDNKLNASTRRSNLIDADVTELFSNITRQQDILKTSYQASKTMLNQRLMDFLR